MLSPCKRLTNNGRDSWIKGQQLLNLVTKTRRSKSWKKCCEFDRPGAVQLRNGIVTSENNGPVRNAGNSGNEMLSPCKRLTNNGRDSWIKGQQLLNLGTKTRRSKSWKKCCEFDRPGAVQLRNGIATPENNGPVRNAGNSRNEMLSPCKRLTNNGRDSWIKGQQLLNLGTK